MLKYSWGYDTILLSLTKMQILYRAVVWQCSALPVASGFDVLKPYTQFSRIHFYFFSWQLEMWACGGHLELWDSCKHQLRWEATSTCIHSWGTNRNLYWWFLEVIQLWNILMYHRWRCDKNQCPTKKKLLVVCEHILWMMFH